MATEWKKAPESGGAVRPRIGRKPKEMQGPGRSQVGLVLPNETKARIVESAIASGRTIAGETAYLIEQALAMRGLFKDLAELERQSVGAAFVRKGYRPVHTPDGVIYAPIDHPYFGVFVPWDPDEVRPDPVEVLVEVPEPESITSEQIEQVRSMQAQLDELQAKIDAATKRMKGATK